MKQLNNYIVEKLKLNKDSKADNIDDLIEYIETIISDYLALKYKWKLDKEYSFSVDTEKGLPRIMLYSKEFNQHNDIFAVYKDLKSKLFSKYVEKIDVFATAIYFTIKKELI